MIILIIVFEMILIILLYRFNCNSYRTQGWIYIHDISTHHTLYSAEIRAHRKHNRAEAQTEALNS